MTAPNRTPLGPVRPTDNLSRLGYEAAMDPAKAWAVMNASRASDPRSSVLDAKAWFSGAVRQGIVFG